MNSNSMGWSAVLCAAGAVGVVGVAATGALGQSVMLGPTPYACFSDSPFASLTGTRYFHLETFEDGVLNTPGVSGSGNVIGPGPLTDSVDCDDGSVDGNGNGGHSYFKSLGFPGGIAFGFDGGVLGQLPTHVGLVWTDGATINNIIFQAFDGSNVLIGQVQLLGHGDGSLGGGGTAEDRFLGVINASGISSIRITSTPAVGASGSGIEVDHLQYGAVLACAADFNGDGDVNADDLGDFITGYFSVPPGPRADFNGDGDINPDDLGDFITTYFAGC